MANKLLNYINIFSLAYVVLLGCGWRIAAEGNQGIDLLI